MLGRRGVKIIVSWKIFRFGDKVLGSVGILEAQKEVILTEGFGFLDGVKKGRVADFCGTDSICTAARGSIYDSSKSSTYKELGLYSLGVDSRLNGAGYADYGFDAVTFGSTGVTLDSTIIGSINTTEFFLGMFGLGIVPGSFNNTSSLAAISGLVEKNGAIPSNSYGYTAGATYRMPSKPSIWREMLTR